jgi:hypothetical protein
MRVYWSTLDSIDSVGLIANSDPGAVVIDIDDVQVETLAWKYSVRGNLIAESWCGACIDLDGMISDSDVSENQIFDVGRFTGSASGGTGIFLRSVGGPASTIRVFQNTIRSEVSLATEGNQIGIDNRGLNNYVAFNHTVGFPAGQAVSDTGSGTTLIGNLGSDTDDDFSLSAGSAINWGTDVNLYRGAANTLKTDDRLVYANVGVFAASDTTPSVAIGNLFRTANSGATTITALDDGVQGQKVMILCGDTNTTFSDAGILRLASGFICTADDTLTLVFDGTNWLELARSAN